ncbi:hypothetical protein GX411_09870 [Candidatus Fermentibacteria bacterium]|nr:hypothetical protein [Candidatus Fermentibacteria bacterium]
MKRIGLLLHIYQPPTQDRSVVERIDAECYRPVASLLARTGAKVTLNINYSLTEQLSKAGSTTLDDLSRAGGVEFTGSGAFHPLLPLIPEAEMDRQIALNTLGNERLLGPSYAPRGFFPPEMAVSPGVLGRLAALGFEWAVADDLPWVASGRDAPYDWVPSCRGLRVLLRSNFWSNRIAFHGGWGDEVAADIVRGLEAWAGTDADAYLIVAMDGETFGHHRRGGVETFLEPFLASFAQGGADVVLDTLSGIAGAFPARDAEVPPGSWSTTPEDIAAGKPWPLWDDPDCPDHAALRALLSHVLSSARASGSERVAALADRMLYSCPFWWASPGRRSPLQVRRGIQAILETALAVFELDGDRRFMDEVMSAAGRVPSMCAKDGN